MYFRLSVFNVLTMVLMGLTAWLGAARFKSKLESNWPLFYYLALVGYLKRFDGSFDPLMVYVGVVSALFLRFEFMGGWFLRLVQTVELFILAYVVYRGFQLIMMW